MQAIRAINVQISPPAAAAEVRPFLTKFVTEIVAFFPPLERYANVGVFSFFLPSFLFIIALHTKSSVERSLSIHAFFRGFVQYAESSARRSRLFSELALKFPKIVQLPGGMQSGWLFLARSRDENG